ncbi:MAG: EAL domain-containing protein [Cellvibrionaceae bacterium]
MFFSLKWKAVSLILAILMMLCGFLISLNGFQLKDLANHQQDRNFHSLHKALDGLLTQSYRNNLQLIDLLPSMSSTAEDNTTLPAILDHNWPLLQLNWGINNATLYAEDGHPLWKTSLQPAPQPTTPETQEPQWYIHCESSCQQVISAPIIDLSGKVYFLRLEIMVSDMLLDFQKITNTNIGLLVSNHNNSNNSIKQLDAWQQQVKLITEPKITLPLLSALEEKYSISDIIDNSSSITFDGSTYEASVTRTDDNSGNGYFVIIVNTTDSSELMASARNSLILVSLGGITISCILLVSFLWGPISRLHTQAELLPLLTTGEFTSAMDRLKSNRSSHWFKDEIDTLNDTEELVCKQLTEMRQEIDKKADRLHNMAMFDSLTELANRRAFMEYINEALEREDLTNNSFSLLFIDLDNFKRINDSMGHNAGDELLKIVAQRLRSCVRSSDIISRLGGDEFCIILNVMSNDNDHGIVADHILKRLRVPIKLGATELIISASIGIVSAPQDGSTSEELLQNADLAMYRAKALGRNKYQKFNSLMTDQAIEQMELEGELRRAIREQEFVLYYQPQVDFNNSSIFGFEALIRWQHPTKGMQFPDSFIGTLEETGLIVPLGSWIIDEACRQLREWLDAGARSVRVAINISPRQLQSYDLSSQVEQALKKYELSPENLELEVTESMIMENIELTQKQLSSLQELGVTVAIDDFGTGHSSLSYLKSLPLDILKIDRAFIMDITQENNDQEIVSAIIAMAHKLKLKVVAEGVETPAHQLILTQNGCDYGQGYLYSRPIPSADALELIRPARTPTAVT